MADRTVWYALLPGALVFFSWRCWTIFGLGERPTGYGWELILVASLVVVLVHAVLRRPKHAPIGFQITPGFIKTSDQAGHTCVYHWVDLRRVSILYGKLLFNGGRELHLQFSMFVAFDETMWDCMVRIAGDSAPALKREWALWESIPEFHSLHNWLLLAWVIASMTFLLAVLSLPLFGPEYDVQVGAAPFVVIFGGGAVLFLQKRLRFMGIKIKHRFLQGQKEGE